MTLWLPVLAVTISTWAMKASGPLAVGGRQLPASAMKVSALMAPVLLAGLIVVDLGGAQWKDLNWQQVVGVAVAGLARTAKAPMLLAILCGIATTAVLRLLLN
jgi:branched-subunit amino acid transport protein